MFKGIFKEDTPELPEGPSGYVVDNQCFRCQWLNRDNPTTCQAFPNGIPLIILLGEFDHSVPYDEDGVSDDGLTFSPVAEV